MPFTCSDPDTLAVLSLVGDTAKANHICSNYDVGALGVTIAVYRYLADQVDRNTDNIQQTQNALNVNFLLTSSYQVFVMQAGFALYAAGVIRAKNVVNILSKNFMDACVGAVMFYLVGYAFAFGQGQHTNGFIGFWEFGLVGYERMELGQAPWQLFVWNWAFCSACVTVLSGAVAERVTFVSYLLYSAYLSSWVYPVVAHWLWSKHGWLNPNYVQGPLLHSGCIDFAGSGVVHTLAGVASLIGAWLVGPRYGRFQKGADPATFKGSSPSTYVLGTFLLWFGWFGFNPGSLQRIATAADANIVARTAVNTILSGGTGAVSILLLTYFHTRKWDLLAACSGSISGLVAITASCALVDPWAAVICGSVGAAIFLYGEMLEQWLHIDDPVSAFPMHGLCGLWGLLFCGLLARREYIEAVYRRPMYGERYGAFLGGDGGLLVCQIIGAVVIISWTAAHMLIFFWLLRRQGLLRVKVEEEVVGLDVVAHGSVQLPSSVNPYADRVQGHGEGRDGASKQQPAIARSGSTGVLQPFGSLGVTYQPLGFGSALFRGSAPAAPPPNNHNGSIISAGASAKSGSDSTTDDVVHGGSVELGRRRRT